MVRHDRLPPELATAVEDLRLRAQAVDGTSALDEAAQLALKADGPAARHLLVFEEEQLVGMASILPDGTVQGMVDPAHRRRGIGGQLLEEVLDEQPDPAVWIHGELPASREFLTARGFRVVRVLVRMERAVVQTVTAPGVVSPREQPADAAAPTVPSLPEAVITSFDAARDTEDFLRVNRAAFVDHPEQGSLTREGLAARLREPWFDPEGFLLLRARPEGGELLGFVWTKQEKGTSLGEIYVVGTAPEAQGRGVASALLRAALEHLRRRGADTIELYVEGDNHGAINLYRRFGFAEAASHVQMRRQEMH